jgi:carbonic anhydrase/acetyltransferase-like protein (isoleucine patch superfamily)
MTTPGQAPGVAAVGDRKDLQMPIYAFENKRPQIDPSAYIAPTAVVIGEVVIGDLCYVGHGAIVRGDYGRITVGDGCAIEEGAIIHARPGDATTIAERVTVGHGAMIHNARIDAGATIGMRAVISDFAVVGEGALVGEQALVRRGQQIPPRVIAVGIPARVIGEVGDEQADMMVWAKQVYADLARRYPSGLEEISREQASSR